MAALPREIILGVGGGIAAYKGCDLLRRLQDSGYAVTVVPTPSSLNFVGKATWEALSGREVTTDVFESVEQVRHVSLAKVAQAIVIAPATADLIARIAAGRADDLLTNVVLASTSPILIVPAMHPAMWFNEATQANVRTLRARGIDVMEPSEGALTSGDVGKGRFPATQEIIERFQSLFLSTSPLTHGQDLIGKKVLITTGGTREPIDPIRFIGNYSSGLQGLALAEAARIRGAEVTLIAANVVIESHRDIRRINISTVNQMSDALSEEFPRCDYLFMSAAVSDARAETIHSEKIKKSDLTEIKLVRNPDLLQGLISVKKSQIVVAFAAETGDNQIELAQEKLSRKGADLIYLNNVSDGAIFGSPKTSGFIIGGEGVLEEFSDITKEKLAHALINQARKRVDKLK